MPLRFRGVVAAWIVGLAIGFVSARGGNAQDATIAAGADASATQEQAQPVKTDFLGDPLPPHALARLGTNRFCPSSVSEIALSRDEKIVISISQKLTAWDSQTGKMLWERPSGGSRFSAAAYGVRYLCRMPKSGRLAAVAEPGTVRFWDMETGESTSIKIADAKPNSRYKSLDVSPDEKWLAVGSADHLVVCDLAGNRQFEIANQPKKRLDDNNDRLVFGGHFSYARFSPDGKRLVLVNSEKPTTLQVVDAQTGAIQREITTKDNLVRMDFSNDGQQIATTQRDIAARLYDLNTGDQVWERVFSVRGMDERYTTDVQFSPGDELIAVGTAIGEDHRIQLLDPKSGEPVGALQGHGWKPWSVRFTANGEQMYSSGWDSVIRRWDVTRREQIRLKNAVRATGVCAVSPNGQTLLYCDDNGMIHRVDPQTGKGLEGISVDGVTFSQLIYSQDSRWLAGGGSSKNDIHIYVWDLDSGEIKHHWEWTKGKDVHASVEGLSFSRDAKRLAACVFRQSACFVFDLPSDQQIAKVRHGNVYGLSLSPDGQQFVSAGWDKQIRLWDCELGTATKRANVKNPVDDDTRMYGVLFAPDGKSIATLSLGGMIRTWDLEMEEPRLSFKIKSRAVYGSFQYSRNGLWLAVGRMDGGCSVYDVQTGTVVWDRAKHANHIYNVEFGAHDQTLLTGGEDGVCYLWDLNAVNQPSPDWKQLASDLIGSSPQKAFDAHHLLAKHPAQALPAIKAAIDELFKQKVEPEADQLLIQDQGIHRAAQFLAETDSADADGLLDHMFKTSPQGTFKKTVFLAKKHQKKYLERIHPRKDR